MSDDETRDERLEAIRERAMGFAYNTDCRATENDVDWLLDELDRVIAERDAAYNMLAQIEDAIERGPMAIMDVSPLDTPFLGALLGDNEGEPT